MIIFIVDNLDIVACKLKCNPPVPADINSPGSGSITLQFVQPKSWQVHIFWLPGGMQAAEY